MPSPRSLPREVERVVLKLFEDLATPVSLGLALQVKYGCWDDIALRKIDPKHYFCFEDFGQQRASKAADRFWRDAVAINHLRKLEELPTNIDREAAALDAFWSSERECFRANERLSPYLFGCDPSGVNAPCDTAVKDLLFLAAKKIADVLGPYHDNVETLVGRFGPGSTFGDKGRLNTVPDKMSSRPTLTTSAIYSLFPWSGTAWATACAVDGRDPSFVRGNRFTTVPKDCTKFRGICIEPSINLFFQLAHGQVLKRKLSRAGLDQLKAQEIHKRVACEASIRGHFATIDLSNASDTICINLVKLLLPRRWYEALSDLRSSHTLLNGKWVKLEKFSSMGNGFTFELETIIFLGICLAVGSLRGVELTPGVDLYVFGDDIIVPTELSQDVIAALRILGFTPNPRKTCTDGLFRESCGGDFFDGVDVRPFYLQELPYEPQQYIAWANGLRAMAFTDIARWGRQSPLLRAWHGVLDTLPSHLRRLKGPKDLGDLVIHDEEGSWSVRWRNSIRYIRCYRPARFNRVGWEHFKPDVILATAVYGAGDGLRGVIPRGPVAGFKVGWVARS